MNKPDEVHRVRPRGVPNAGAPVPVELRYTTLLILGWFHQIKNSLNMVI